MYIELWASSTALPPEPPSSPMLTRMRNYSYADTRCMSHVARHGFKVYMGVHSTPDLVGAAVLSKLILYVYMPFNDLVQPWVEESTEALYVPFVAAALVLWYYPRPTQWAVSFVSLHYLQYCFFFP